MSFIHVQYFDFVVEALKILLLTLILLLLAKRQLLQSMSRVEDAAYEFGVGGRPEGVIVQGPLELRDLITSFNEMMRHMNEASDHEAVVLAGVAHDLKAPLIRLKQRAAVIGTENDRMDFTRDIDSLVDIVHQFLVLAGQRADAGAPVAVETFLRERFSITHSAEVPRVRLDPKAGPLFTLDRTVLDRLITNLVDNALEHGAPPIDISTSRDERNWIISVRDHGAGIPEDRMAAAMKPFVRLGDAYAGKGHYGLGLAIVARLAHDSGGRCDVHNHPDGGLCVRILLPVAQQYAECTAAEVSSDVDSTICFSTPLSY
jgi:two-component system osmolarity sensor histidine kinase EnvZ